MKILCPNCFEQITKINNDKAICTACNSEFNINVKTGIFKVRLDGGFIKEGMTYGEVAKSIKDGTILADEYIATPQGPWITVYDSPFEKFIPKKGRKKLKKARTAVSLYKKRRSAQTIIIILALLFAISFAANVFMLTIMQQMENRIEILVKEATGGK